MCTIWKIVLVPIFGTGAMATCDPRVTYIHMNKTFCEDNVWKFISHIIESLCNIILIEWKFLVAFNENHIINSNGLLVFKSYIKK